MATIKKPAKKMQMGGGIKPMMKKGGSFPDLNKDGKITKADILKGRGVIAKKGMKVKKAQTGSTVIGSKKKLERVKSEGNPSNPPLKSTYSTSTFGKNGPKLNYNASVDTTGYAAGKKEFPSIKTDVKSGKSYEQVVGRKAVESRMKNPNRVGLKKGGSVKKKMKMGGKTKKCAYGCK